MKKRLVRNRLPDCMVAMLLAAVLYVTAGNCIAEEVLSGETAKQYVLMLCDGFDKNRDAFQQFTCRFSLVCGSTECPAQWWQRDSWDAEVTTVDQTADGLLARDGNIFRYKLTAGKFGPKPSSIDNESGGSGSSTTPSFGVLAGALGCFGYGNEDTLFDDEYVISDLEIGPQAIISPVRDWPEFRSSIISPWQPKVTFLSQYPYLEAVRHLVMTSDKFFFTVKRDADSGLGILNYLFVNQPLEYVVDERRGYLPTRVVETSKSGARVRVRALYTEVAEIKGYGWFPLKWTFVDSIGSENDVSCSVTQLRVTELTMGRPNAELLAVNMSKGRRLIDQTNLGRLKQLVIEDDMAVTIKDVPKLVDRYRNPTQYAARSKPPRKQLWPPIVILACGMLIAISLGYVCYSYRRRLVR